MTLIIISALGVLSGVARVSALSSTTSLLMPSFPLGRRYTVSSCQACQGLEWPLHNQRYGKWRMRMAGDMREMGGQGGPADDSEEQLKADYYEAARRRQEVIKSQEEKRLSGLQSGRKDIEEIDGMEREYYEAAKQHQEVQRLKDLKTEIDEFPRHRQCHRYRWHQMENTFDVEIPVATSCRVDDLHLVLEPEQFMLAINNDESFGAVTGRFTGSIDSAKSTVSVQTRNGECYIHVILYKASAEGTYEFWASLFQGEIESPTIRFKGKTSKYSWVQNAETLEIHFPVPREVTKKGTRLELHPNGRSMSLSFDQYPKFGKQELIFKDQISPWDSVWMLDSSSSEKVLSLTIKKRRETRDRTSWWSGVFEGDDKWEADEN